MSYLCESTQCGLIGYSVYLTITYAGESSKDYELFANTIEYQIFSMFYFAIDVIADSLLFERKWERQR